jgi:inosine-uridine nucleoside N-ribohydrolase
MDIPQVIHSHDGAADDQLALLFLVQLHKSRKINLLAVSIMPADSHPEPAIKMSNYIVNGLNIPVILHNKKTPNQFPETWKDETYDACRVMGANHDCFNKAFDISKLMEIIKYNIDIIFIETGPLTTLADCLELDKNISFLHIIKVIWTGGSFDNNPGKTIKKSGDLVMEGTQSWNAFIDPPAVEKVLSADWKVVMFPSEIINQVKLTQDFYNKLPNTEAGKIFHDVYKLYLDKDYSIWDVLTATYIEKPGLFEIQSYQVYVHTKSVYAGKTVCTDMFWGNKVDVVKKIVGDPYSLILDVLNLKN